MKKVSNKICISVKLCSPFIKNANTFFLKSESIVFGIFLLAAAILINSKKIDAISLDLASTDSTALLIGARIA